jgi:MFS family permease
MLVKRFFDATIRVYREAFTGLPRDVWLLSIILLINRSGAMVLPFLTLYFTVKLGFNNASAGLLLSSYGLGAISGAALGGYLTVRLGSIRVQVLSLFATAVGFVVLSLLRSYWPIAICLFVLSTVAEAIRPANSTAITERTPPGQYRQALALSRMAVNMGMSIGPTAGGFLAFFNYYWLFAADAATCAIAGVAILVFFPLTPLPTTSDNGPDADNRLKTNAPWNDKIFMFFWGLIFLAAIVFFQLMATFPIYLREKFSMSEWQIGLTFAFNTVLIVLIEMALVKSLERFSTLRLIGWGCFLSCLGFGLLPFGYGFVFCLFTVFVWTIGEILSMPMAMAFTAERSNDQNRGWYMGSYTMCYAIAFVIAPVLGLAIYQYYPDLVWYLSLVVGLLVLAGFFALDRLAAKDLVKNENAAQGELARR